METTKTFKGRTAYSYFRKAWPQEMTAGNVELVADNGCTLHIDGQRLILRDASGIVAALEASDRVVKGMMQWDENCKRWGNTL